MTTIASVVGARPQFIKAGPISKALAQAGAKELLVHTGQHYDPVMSERILKAIELREPVVNLGVGSASHGVQTAGMLEGVESVLMARNVDAVLTNGDTNSTTGCGPSGGEDGHNYRARRSRAPIFQSEDA